MLFKLVTPGGFLYLKRFNVKLGMLAKELNHVLSKKVQKILINRQILILINRVKFFPFVQLIFPIIIIKTINW